MCRLSVTSLYTEQTTYLCFSPVKILFRTLSCPPAGSGADIFDGYQWLLGSGPRTEGLGQGPFPRVVTFSRVLRRLLSEGSLLCFSTFVSTSLATHTLQPPGCHQRPTTIAYNPFRRLFYPIRTFSMPKPVSLSFLGTCSGGGPLLNRSCSSSLLDIGGSIWSK